MRTGTTIRAVATALLVTLAAMSNAIAGSGDDNDASYPEVGVEWVNDYTYPYSDLSNCDDSANGLYNRLGNIGWTKRFNKGNSDAKATHFESAGQDSSYIDAVDIALYSGHGHSDRLDIFPQSGRKCITMRLNGVTMTSSGSVWIAAMLEARTSHTL